MSSALATYPRQSLSQTLVQAVWGIPCFVAAGVPEVLCLSVGDPFADAISKTCIRIWLIDRAAHGELPSNAVAWSKASIVDLRAIRRVARHRGGVEIRPLRVAGGQKFSPAE